uniref:Leucine rich repeat containing 34 n=1 Tax=Eptatretus burgeri TaxID=7764 RepID=A0A8C4Q5G7_EPTBU
MRGGLQLEPQQHGVIDQAFLQAHSHRIGGVDELQGVYLAGSWSKPQWLRLGDAEANRLVSSLHRTISIAVLDLRYNNISDNGTIVLAKLLKDPYTLTTLNLSYNNIGAKGAQAIAQAMHDNVSLQKLILSGNPLSNEGGVAISSMLLRNHALCDLDLGHCDLGLRGLVAVTTAAACHPNLITLCLDRPLLFCHEVRNAGEHVYRLLSSSTLHLHKLSLAHVGLRHDDTSRLCEALACNRTIRDLDLCCNQIAQDGAFALGKVLALDTPLRFLKLSRNQVKDPGVWALAAGLTNNRHLLTLALQSNEVTGEGLAFLERAMKRNNTLRDLYIWGNTLDNTACQARALFLCVDYAQHVSQSLSTDYVVFLSAVYV